MSMCPDMVCYALAAVPFCSPNNCVANPTLWSHHRQLHKTPMCSHPIAKQKKKSIFVSFPSPEVRRHSPETPNPWYYSMVDSLVLVAYAVWFAFDLLLAFLDHPYVRSIWHCLLLALVQHSVVLVYPISKSHYHVHPLQSTLDPCDERQLFSLIDCAHETIEQVEISSLSFAINWPCDRLQTNGKSVNGIREKK